MVKSFFWFISNPAIWSDWKFRPANVFCKTEKSSFGFWTLNTHGSKGNFQKLLTCVNHVYFKHRTVVFRSKKNFNFPFQKIEFLFSPHAEFILFCFQKPSIMEERSTKKTDIVETKKNLLKILVQRKKLRKKKKYFFWFLTRKWKVGLWCIKKVNFKFRKDLHRDHRSGDSCLSIG